MENDSNLPQSSYREPWVEVGFRDENARMLVAATYKHREALLHRAPDVPVQGYQLLSAEQGQSGALTCGSLITLWQNSPICVGPCPCCKGIALAFAFGGKDDPWYVFGCCIECGSTVYRAATLDQITNELRRALQGTAFTPPTARQLLHTNGHTHQALISELEALGEILLPPHFFGFIVAAPETMRAWTNTPRARAWNWTHTVTIVHPPTGARMDPVQGLIEQIANFVEAYLYRTGHLPELEQLGPEGLALYFPMTSQEPLVRVLPEDSPEELAAYENDGEPPEQSDMETDIDLVVESFRAGALADDALCRVKDRMEEESVYDYASQTGALSGMWLSPETVAAEYLAIDEDELRQACELAEWEPVTEEHRMQFLEGWRLPPLEEDADVAHLLMSVLLTASSGDSVVLVVDVRGYSFSGVSTNWSGVLETEGEYLEQIKKEGWVKGADGFAELSLERKVEIVRNVTKKVAR